MDSLQRSSVYVSFRYRYSAQRQRVKKPWRLNGVVWNTADSASDVKNHVDNGLGRHPVGIGIALPGSPFKGNQISCVADHLLALLL